MTAAIWRGRLRASGARPLRQFAHPVCSLAGLPHCKIRLQTFRGAGGGTAPAPGRVGASARGWIGPGSAAYRWLALGGQLGQRARRLDGRGPATASRSSGVTRPGAEVQGEPTAASSAAWLELELCRCGARQRAGVPRCRELAEKGARKQHASLLPRIAIDLFTTLCQTPAAPIRQFNAKPLITWQKRVAFHTGTNGLY